MIMDPPYMIATNEFYDNDQTLKMNIYEYMVDNNKHNNKKNLCLILENIWIIKLLFKKYKRIEYDKKYHSYKKKK